MSTLTTAVQGLAQTVVRKDFSTGSKGFYSGGKVADDTSLYQAQVSAILVGSKNDLGAIITATADEASLALQGFLASALRDKVFSSGKTGVYGQGKVAIGGQVFQVQAQAVKVR
jgi:hypothetical protein